MEDVLNKKTHNPSALPTSAAHATLPTQEGQHAPCTTFLSLFRGGGDFDKSTIIFKLLSSVSRAERCDCLKKRGVG